MPVPITVETTVVAPVDRVWRAYTTPAAITRWNAASDDWHTTAAAVDLRPGGAFGVDPIGLGPGSAGRADRAVELDDHFPVLGEVAGQAGAVAAGAFDRPGPQPAVAIGPSGQLCVAVGVRGHGHGVEQCAVSGGEQRGGVGVGVGVDPDDELDQFCQHGHAFS